MKKKNKEILITILIIILGVLSMYAIALRAEQIDSKGDEIKWMIEK